MEKDEVGDGLILTKKVVLVGDEGGGDGVERDEGVESGRRKKAVKEIESFFSLRELVEAGGGLGGGVEMETGLEGPEERKVKIEGESDEESSENNEDFFHSRQEWF